MDTVDMDTVDMDMVDIDMVDIDMDMVDMNIVVLGNIIGFDMPYHARVQCIENAKKGEGPPQPKRVGEKA